MREEAVREEAVRDMHVASLHSSHSVDPLFILAVDLASVSDFF